MNDKHDIKAGLSCMVVTFFIWGFQPFYWNLGQNLDTMFLMLWRICTAAVFCLILLKIQGKLKQLKDAFKNKAVLKREIPAAFFLAIDWFVYLYAVKAGRVQEVSFGYYLMPVVIFSFGAFVYKEKIRTAHILVLVLVAAGIIASFKGFGEFPWVALTLSCAFAVYSAIKKGITEDGVVTTTMEILMMFPFALLFLLIFYRGESGLSSMSWRDILFVAGAGLVTCVPMFFYSLGVNRLSMFTTALCHYISPTLSIICSLILGEELTSGKLISFAFIWLGIIVYTVDFSNKIKEENKEELK